MFISFKNLFISFIELKYIHQKNKLKEHRFKFRIDNITGDIANLKSHCRKTYYITKNNPSVYPQELISTTEQLRDEPHWIPSLELKIHKMIETESAVKQLLEALLLAIKMCTDLTTDLYGWTPKCAGSLANHLRSVADVFFALRTHQRNWTSERCWLVVLMQ